MSWHPYNPNPIALEGIDCTVRALTKALDISWEQAYTMLSANGFMLSDMPNANHVVNYTLRQNGFKRHLIPDECPDCFTTEDFAEAHPEGTFILAFGDHVCCVYQGDWWDSWDSGGRIPVFYWEKITDRKDEE